MTELVACRACRRHVRVDATHCPFCDHARLDLPRVARHGRLGRAAIFAAATLAPACWTDKQPPRTTPVERPTSDAPAPGTIVGFVRDMRNNAGLAGFRVRLGTASASAAQHVTSGADGRFAFHGLAPGTYRLFYLHPQGREMFLDVLLDAKRGQFVEVPIHFMEHNIEATPYGAPPARRRIV